MNIIIYFRWILGFGNLAHGACPTSLASEWAWDEWLCDMQLHSLCMFIGDKSVKFEMR